MEKILLSMLNTCFLNCFVDKNGFILKDKLENVTSHQFSLTKIESPDNCVSYLMSGENTNVNISFYLKADTKNPHSGKIENISIKNAA